MMKPTAVVMTTITLKRILVNSQYKLKRLGESCEIAVWDGTVVLFMASPVVYLSSTSWKL